MSDLQIPEIAQLLALEAVRYRERRLDIVVAALETGAPYIVAFELRRLAEDISRGMAEYVRDGASELLRAQAAERLEISRRLLARADELDGGAK